MFANGSPAWSPVTDTRTMLCGAGGLRPSGSGELRAAAEGQSVSVVAEVSLDRVARRRLNSSQPMSSVLDGTVAQNVHVGQPPENISRV